MQVTFPTLTVTWSPPAGATPIGYQLDFGAAGIVVASLVVGPATAVTLNVPAGTFGTFTLVMTAIGVAGTSSPSTPVSFTINDAANCIGPPRTPRALEGSVIGGTAIVSWESALDALSYVLQAGTAPNTSDLFDANVGHVTSLTASGLPASFRAHVSVRAVNACGTSPPATLVLGVGCLGPPAPPTGLRGGITGGVAVVEWDASPGATSYVLLAGTSPAASDLYRADVGSAIRVSAGGLPAGFQAYVSVVAINACGTSGISPQLFVLR